MDLLPTLVGLAEGADASSRIVGPLDGAEPAAAARRQARRPATDLGRRRAEYLAEGASRPIVMLRRGPLKLVHSPG